MAEVIGGEGTSNDVDFELCTRKHFTRYASGNNRERRVDNIAPSLTINIPYVIITPTWMHRKMFGRGGNACVRFDLRQEAKDHIILVAHRGVAGGNIPCNTIAAFQAALLQKADMIELDVGKSKDGTLYIFHEGCEQVQLGIDKKLGDMTDDEIRRLRYLNTDAVSTIHGVNTFDEAFEFLKGRCYINVDKFTFYPEEIIRAIRRHGMEDQVVIKTPAERMQLDMIEALAPDFPYIVIINEADTVTDAIASRKVNFVGVETVFKTEQSPVGTDAYREKARAHDWLLWGNSIVFNHKRLLSAGHNDDVSITGAPQDGWGWLAQKGFDMIQTDWPLQAYLYLQQTDCYERRQNP